MNKKLIGISMPILALALILSHYNLINDFLLGLILGVSIGLNLLVLFKGDIEILKKIEFMKIIKEIIKTMLLFFVMLIYFGIGFYIQEKSMYLYLVFLLLTVILTIFLIKKLYSKPDNYILNSVSIGWLSFFYMISISMLFEVGSSTKSNPIDIVEILQGVLIVTLPFVVIGVFMKLVNNKKMEK